MKVEVHRPNQKLYVRNVQKLAEWSARMAKELEVDTTLIVRKPQGGTIQYRLQPARYWKMLRETYGP